MKLARFMVLPLLLAIGCGSKGSGEGSGAASTPPPVVKPSGNAVGTGAGFAASPGGGATAPAGSSFFSGDPPATVKMKPTKSSAMGQGILLIQGVEGWSGGLLPGNDYMTMSKDTTAMGRVATSTAMVDQMGCKEISTAAAMAPLKAKNLTETSPAALRKVGKNKFVAREGECAAEGPKGPLVIHFLNIARKEQEGIWHYAVIVGFPKDASADLKNEAMAWARSLEFNGQNGYTMP